MLRLGNAIRLTRKEAERLERITGFPVDGVRTLDGLALYVAQCKAYYAEDSKEFEILARKHLNDLRQDAAIEYR